MPFFTGPGPAVLLAGVLIVAVALWLLRDWLWLQHAGTRRTDRLGWIR